VAFPAMRAAAAFPYPGGCGSGWNRTGLWGRRGGAGAGWGRGPLALSRQGLYAPAPPYPHRSVPTTLPALRVEGLDRSAAALGAPMSSDDV